MFYTIFEIFLGGKQYMSLFRKNEKEYTRINKVGRFVDGIAVVKLNNGKYVYINNRNEVLSQEFCYAGDFSGGMAVVRITDGANYYLINQNMKIVSDRYEYISNNFRECGFANAFIFYPDLKSEGYLMRNGKFFNLDEANLVNAMCRLFMNCDISQKDKELLFKSKKAVESVVCECNFRIRQINNVNFGYDNKLQAITKLKQINNEFEMKLKSIQEAKEI